MDTWLCCCDVFCVGTWWWWIIVDDDDDAVYFENENTCTHAYCRMHKYINSRCCCALCVGEMWKWGKRDLVLMILFCLWCAKNENCNPWWTNCNVCRCGWGKYDVVVDSCFRGSLSAQSPPLQWVVGSLGNTLNNHTPTTRSHRDAHL